MLDFADFTLQEHWEDNLMVSISRAWYNGSYTMAAKPIKSFELHYTMIQFLINVYMFISLKVSAQWRQTVWRRLEQNLHTSKKICVHDQISTAMFINIHWIQNYLSRIFSLSFRNLFFEDCIKEIIRFVAAVNNFPWEINSSNTAALYITSRHK